LSKNSFQHFYSFAMPGEKPLIRLIILPLPLGR
jgi:hypothetical protein